MAAITFDQYIDLIFGARDFICDTVIRGITGDDSKIENRYISSEGSDDEEWIGNLRNADGVVDIWVTALSSLLVSRSSAVMTIDKPIRMTFDYYADYKHGTDESNTQEEFEKKILKFDLELERRQTGLSCPAEGETAAYAQVQVPEFTILTGIKRFSSASCHFAKCNVSLLFTEIQIKN